MAQSLYAQPSDLQSVGITPAAAVRFGASAIMAQLQAASSVADSYIVSQFELPLETDPIGWDQSLVLCVCNIAAFYLYSQFGFNPSGSTADEMIERRYQEAIKWLENIRDKKVFPQWTDSSGDSDASDNAGAYIVSDPPVGFTNRGVTDDSPVVADPWGWNS
jgi:phage gp36-like protein